MDTVTISLTKDEFSLFQSAVGAVLAMMASDVPAGQPMPDAMRMMQDLEVKLMTPPVERDPIVDVLATWFTTEGFKVEAPLLYDANGRAVDLVSLGTFLEVNGIRPVQIGK